MDEEVITNLSKTLLMDRELCKAVVQENKGDVAKSFEQLSVFNNLADSLLLDRGLFFKAVLEETNGDVSQVFEHVNSFQAQKVDPQEDIQHMKENELEKSVFNPGTEIKPPGVDSAIQREEEERWRKEFAQREEKLRRAQIAMEKARRKELLEREMQEAREQEILEAKLLAEQEEARRKAVEELAATRRERERVARELEAAKHALASETEILLEQEKKLTEMKVKQKQENEEEQSSPVVPAEPQKKQMEFEKAPLVTIYVLEDHNSKSLNLEDTVSIQEALRSAGVQAPDIKVVDLSKDFELKSYVKELMTSQKKDANAVHYPLVFLKQKFLGDRNTIKTIITGEEFRLLLKEDMSKQTEVESVPKLSALDRTLEGVETVMSYINPLGWLRWGQAKTSKDVIIEIDVIHTNWYWRNQQRKLCFGPDAFVRVHPKFGDARASHKYEDIQLLERKSPTTVVFHYKSTSSADWISSSKENINEVITVLKSKNVNIKV